MFSEFKKFIMRGNVLDLAIGVIIGSAFGKIVASLVNDVLMPVIGLVLGKIDFSNLFITLSPGKDGVDHFATLAAAKADGAPVLAYGMFLNVTIEFLIVAFVIFMVVKAANKFQKPAPAAAPTTKPCPECTTAIPLAAKRCPACTAVIA